MNLLVSTIVGKLSHRKISMPRFYRMVKPGYFLLSERRDFMKINGEACTCPANATVLSVLEHRGHDPQRVAVEKNGQIVPRARFAEEPLHEDDVIEIVQFVGGG